MLDLLTRPEPVLLVDHRQGGGAPRPVYVVVTAQGPMVADTGIWGATLEGPQYLSVAFSLGVKPPSAPRPEEQNHAALR